MSKSSPKTQAGAGSSAPVVVDEDVVVSPVGTSHATADPSDGLAVHDPVAVEGRRESGEEFSSTGQTRLVSRPGTVFNAGGEYPLITEAGVNVSAAQAEEILDLARRTEGHVFVVDNKED